jgi:hypothetical protein
MGMSFPGRLYIRKVIETNVMGVCGIDQILLQ